MDKNLFVKIVTDTSRMSGFFMDEITAGLLYERFLDIEYEELDLVMGRILETGQKVTFKNINDNRIKKKKKKEVKEDKVNDCKNDCKECTGVGIICDKLNKIGFDYIKRMGNGLIKPEQAMKELHEQFPKIGFDKKIGRPTGVIIDANGEHITVYKYD